MSNPRGERPAGPDGELRSAPIHAGEFASFCQLKPGRYRYKVVRPDDVEHKDARRRLEGEIVVRQRAPRATPLGN